MRIQTRNAFWVACAWKFFPWRSNWLYKEKFKGTPRIRGNFKLICLVLGGLKLEQFWVIDRHRDVTFWMWQKISLFFMETHILVYTASLNKNLPPAAHSGGIWHLWRKLPNLKDLSKTELQVDITFRFCKIIRREKRQKVFGELF